MKAIIIQLMRLSKTFKDYIEFTSKKVRARAKRLVDIVHKHNRGKLLCS